MFWLVIRGDLDRGHTKKDAGQHAPTIAVVLVVLFFST
jgi:hypothetical protein